MISDYILWCQTSRVFVLLVNTSVALDKVCDLIPYTAVFDKEIAVTTGPPQAPSSVITPLHTHWNCYPSNLPLLHMQLQHEPVLEALCLFPWNREQVCFCVHLLYCVWLPPWKQRLPLKTQQQEVKQNHYNWRVPRTGSAIPRLRMVFWYTCHTYYLGGFFVSTCIASIVASSS